MSLLWHERGKFGIAAFLTDKSASPTELAVEVERRGFESLWLPEHTNIPVWSSSPPGMDTVPEDYARVLDPVVACSYALAATTKLRVGFGVALMAQRDPIIMAKSVTSLDHLSGGRIEIGVGAGWNEAEVAAHGLDPATRFGRLREHLAAMKAIWQTDAASFDGDHLSFDGVQSWPKPTQQPYPPILLGGGGPRIARRVRDQADGWFAPYPVDDDAFIATAEWLRRQEKSVTLAVAPLRADRLARYIEAGVERMCFYVPSAGMEKIRVALQRIEAELSRLPTFS